MVSYRFIIYDTLLEFMLSYRLINSLIINDIVIIVYN